MVRYQISLPIGKYLFKMDNIDNWAMSIDIILLPLLFTLNRYFFCEHQYFYL